MNIKRGFTLAETLVTLVIIGVVAALAGPMLLNSGEEQGKQAGIRKQYSTMANALTRAKAFGAPYDFSFASDSNVEELKKWFDYYLKGNINAIKICYNEAGCWSNYETKLMNGQVAPHNRTGIGLGNNIISMILNDGSFIVLDSVNKADMKTYAGVDIDTDYGLIVYFDINGERKPNIFGKDVFICVWTDGGIVPSFKGRTVEEQRANCGGNASTGYSCINNYLRK